MLLGDRVWLGRFKGKPSVVTSLAQELYSDFAELRAERALTDAAIVVWASSLTKEDFARDLSYVGITSPKPRRYPLWFAVTHFFNHQTHHRGQFPARRATSPGLGIALSPGRRRPDGCGASFIGAKKRSTEAA